MVESAQCLLAAWTYRYGLCSFSSRYAVCSIPSKICYVLNGRGLLATIFLILPVALLSTTQGCSREESSSQFPFRQSTHTNFRSEIVLESYANVELRGHTYLVLTWRAPYDSPRAGYRAFVHAIDKQGNILFQFDHDLVNAAGLPTSLWDREPVKDVFRVTPPTGYSPGKYDLLIGLYVPGGGRLEVFATDLLRHVASRDTAILLPGIDCR